MYQMQMAQANKHEIQEHVCIQVQSCRCEGQRVQCRGIAGAINILASSCKQCAVGKPRMQKSQVKFKAKNSFFRALIYASYLLLSLPLLLFACVTSVGPQSQICFSLPKAMPCICEGSMHYGIAQWHPLACHALL